MWCPVHTLVWELSEITSKEMVAVFYKGQVLCYRLLGASSPLLHLLLISLLPPDKLSLNTSHNLVLMKSFRVVHGHMGLDLSCVYS